MAKTTNPPPYLLPNGAVLTTDPAWHAWKHPRYVEAEARLSDLRTQLGRIDGSINDEITRAHDERSRNRHLEHARALAHGTERPKGSPAADLAALTQERRILTTAVELAERRLREVEGQVSAEICGKAREAYVLICERIVPALRTLAEATSIETAFVRNMIDGGTLVGNLPAVGRVGIDPAAVADVIVAEAKEHYGVDLD